MKLLVLDGNSILNRAFYGIKLLTTKSGEFTNGIVGFLNILEKVKDETEPDAVAIAFDMKAPTFRHKAYAGYKAQRKGMPPELAAQMPVLKELLGDLGYKIVTCEGWEADDILGTFAETPVRFGAENAQAVMGMQMACAYVGSMTMPAFFGKLSDLLGMQIYPVILMAFAALLAFAVWNANRLTLDRK